MGVRRIRAEMDISPGRKLPILLQGGDTRDRERLDANRAYITFLARPESMTWLSVEDEAPESATALVGDLKILIPIAGIIDKDAEIARLSREIGKKRADAKRGEGKLANEKFVDRAPAAVVEKERARVAELRDAIEQLQAQLERIEAL